MKTDVSKAWGVIPPSPGLWEGEGTVRHTHIQTHSQTKKLGNKQTYTNKQTEKERMTSENKHECKTSLRKHVSRGRATYCTVLYCRVVLPVFRAQQCGDLACCSTVHAAHLHPHLSLRWYYMATMVTFQAAMTAAQRDGGPHGLQGGPGVVDAGPLILRGSC